MRRKKTQNKKFWSNPKFLTVICLILLILLSIPLVKKIRQRQKVDSEIQKLQEEIASLEKENQELDKLIKYLKSDQFLEKQSRMNLGFKKSGEEVLVITEEEKKTNKDSSSRDTGSQEEEKKRKYSRSNPQKWWDHFFN